MLFFKPQSPYRLLLSYCLAVVFVLAGLLVVLSFFWFPDGLFFIAGGWDGIKLVVPVDLSLGFLFLLAVFRPGKSLTLLRRDLMVIALVQLSILLAGVFLIYKARPLVVVHVFNTFHVLSEENFMVGGVDLTELDDVDARFEDEGVLAGLKPRVVYVDTIGIETEAAFISTDFLAELNGGRPTRYRMDGYESVPVDLNQAAKALRGELDAENSCIRVVIASNYKSGHVCYNPVSKTFSHFEDGALPAELEQE